MTVKELIALGFGGYAGWNDIEASTDFKETGGSGKFTGGKSLDTFIKKFNGVYADWDGKHGNQCVDLLRYYLVFLFGNGYILPGVNWASELFTKFNLKNTNFTLVPNTANNYPMKGDIIIFRPFWYPYGQGGDVAIVIEGDIKTIKVFGQNFPTGTPPRISTRSYGLFGKAVLGWLHPIIKVV